jgi:putative ABC transport system permease protein
MLEILRNLGRHKLRTGLTTFGIVIGIFALTVMGSMTEYFNTMLDNALKHGGSSIGVTANTREGDKPLSNSTVRRLRRLPGVRAVVPIVIDTLDEMESAVQWGPPDMVYGLPPELSEVDFAPLALRAGRWLQRGDTYQMIIGHKIAHKRGLYLGDTLEWREETFTVVGIMEETGTLPDQLGLVSLEVARRTMKQPHMIMTIDVIPNDPNQAEALADLIQERIDGVDATSLEENIRQIKQQLAVFNVIMVSGALLAAVVGGLAVINTMIMSVNERTREIGVKKAVGATDLDIVKEYLLEAMVIGLFGGVLGLVLGTGMARLLNLGAAESLGGTEIFTVTPRLAIFALFFAVSLGSFGGLYPAWRAARLDPVEALRAE